MADVRDELGKLTGHLATVGITRLALLHEAGADAAEEAAGRAKASFVVRARRRSGASIGRLRHLHDAVLEGTPDHRDTYFTDAERVAGDQFTPCCSRSRTPVLVLDL